MPKKKRQPRKVGKVRKVRGKMSWSASIIKVLKDATEPMHYSDIAKEIGERKLRKLDANAPYSVVATISLSMKEDGEKSPFMRASRGYYALRSAPSVPVAVIESDEKLGQLITSYGLYWHRGRVKWKRAKPEISGCSTLDAPPVNFYGQHGVYILYDAANRPVYVGKSDKTGIGNRLKSHTKDRLQGRWERFSWFGLRKVQSSRKLGEATPLSGSASDLATLLEAVLIETTEPPLNRRQGDGLSGTEYLQPDA